MTVSSKVLRTMPGHSRRQAFSASTKRALVAVATGLFAERGYAGTSLDEIVAGARVTKGALYHHFHGKQALFEAVFENVEERAAAEIRRALDRADDPWQQAAAGLRAFLEVVQQPDYRRIVVQEGPAVMGYERWREQEERSTFAILQDVVSAVLEGNDLPRSVVETFSRVFFGALSAAGSAVSVAQDPHRASLEVEAAIGFVLAGLRSLAESGERLTLPAELSD